MWFVPFPRCNPNLAVHLLPRISRMDANSFNSIREIRGQTGWKSQLTDVSAVRLVEIHAKILHLALHGLVFDANLDNFRVTELA